MSSFLLEINNTKEVFQVNIQLKEKFKNDECFYENEHYLVILEGVILNKTELLINENHSWHDFIINLYLETGDAFYNIFRGSFCGVLYDKVKKKWIIFQDHIGSKNIYYSELDNDIFLCATKISDLYSLRKQKNIQEHLDRCSAYMLLSYGYMLEDYTLSKDIKKILPGNYIKLENNRISHHNYYTIDNSPNNNLSENEVIDKMDFLFKIAIKRQFDKDIEYGYKHFVALSGGLDSRMTTWVAHKMGYTNQLNFTFSQSNYLDETIPKQIASDLKHEWIFKALDNGLFLKNIDNTTRITGGNTLYHGLAHGLSLYNYINFKPLGIAHSGQLGDVVYGSFNKSNKLEILFKNGDGAYSKKLINRINFNRVIKNNYSNKELFCMYQRGFNGANVGLMGIQKYTETMSPFYDIDLLNFAMTIPVKYRSKQKIYKKWILIKYPGAAKYIWEKTGEKINAPRFYYKNKEVTLYKMLKKTLIKLRLVKTGYASKNNMNPIEYWLSTNNDIRLFFDNYFKDNINRVKDSQLKKDCINHYRNGNGIEKTQVLSLLSALKIYF